MVNTRLSYSLVLLTWRELKSSVSFSNTREEWERISPRECLECKMPQSSHQKHTQALHDWHLGESNGVSPTTPPFNTYSFIRVVQESHVVPVGYVQLQQLTHVPLTQTRLSIEGQSLSGRTHWCSSLSLGWRHGSEAGPCLRTPVSETQATVCQPMTSLGDPEDHDKEEQCALQFWHLRGQRSTLSYTLTSEHSLELAFFFSVWVIHSLIVFTDEVFSVRHGDLPQLLWLFRTASLHKQGLSVLASCQLWSNIDLINSFSCQHFISSL